MVENLPESRARSVAIPCLKQRVAEKIKTLWKSRGIGKILDNVSEEHRRTRIIAEAIKKFSVCEALLIIRTPPSRAARRGGCELTDLSRLPLQ